MDKKGQSWETQNSYFSGQGVMLVGVRDSKGNGSRFVPVGNVPDLKLAVAVSTLEHKESMSGKRATDLRLTLETKCTMTAVLENFSEANLALALQGTSSTVVKGSEASSKIELFLGAITSLKHIKVSKVKLEVGADTLTPFEDGIEKWDYKVNLQAGSIMVNSDKATFDKLDFGTADMLEATVSYEYEEQSLVDALDAPNTEFFVRFEGLNTADGDAPVVVEVFKFSADPLKELALISDAIQSFTLEGSVLADASREVGSKFFRVLK